MIKISGKEYKKQGLLRGTPHIKEPISYNTWGILLAGMQDKVSYYNGDIEVNSVKHMLEIVEAALSGRINLEDSFNIYGYDNKITQTEKIKKYKRQKKELALYNDNSDDELRDAYGLISTDNASANTYACNDFKDDYELFFENEDLKDAISFIKDVNEDFIIEYQVDLIQLIKKASKNLPQAVSKLRKICDGNALLSEHIMVILRNTLVEGKVSIDACFA